MASSFLPTEAELGPTVGLSETERLLVGASRQFRRIPKRTWWTVGLLYFAALALSSYAKGRGERR